jgi:phage tail P2-like protein
MDSIVAPVIGHIRHLAAVDEAAAQRFDFDTTPLLVYSIDTVPVAVLLTLAQQFDMMGAGGWDLAVTEDDKRKLIKGAIELHRRKGTVWAVKESIRRVGFPDVAIIEHVSLNSVLYNGEYEYNGTQTYGGGFWADFRVKITVADGIPLAASDRAKVVAMVEEYKNVRSRLVDITFVLLFTEQAAPAEELVVGQDPTSEPDYLTAGLYYNGDGSYNGANQHNKGHDPLELNIYQNEILISTETI